MITHTSSGTERKPLPRWLRNILGQFRRPHGVLGRVAGWIMATRPSNIARNRWTVDNLNVQPTDCILEIGYGPGIAVEALAARATEGFVLGVDHSDLMHRQASARNRAAIAGGHVELRLGTMHDIIDADGPFQKIMTVNCAQFWDDRRETLTRLRQLLSADGTLAITYQPRHPGATEADADRFADQTTALGKELGYSNVETKKLDLEPVCAVCVLLDR